MGKNKFVRHAVFEFAETTNDVTIKDHVRGIIPFGERGVGVTGNVLAEIELAVRDADAEVGLGLGCDSWSAESLGEGFGGTLCNAASEYKFLVQSTISLNPTPKYVYAMAMCTFPS